MQPQPPPYDPLAPEALIALVGRDAWTARQAEIAAAPRPVRVQGNSRISAMRWNWPFSACVAQWAVRPPRPNCT
jgi:hypothetical protein